MIDLCVFPYRSINFAKRYGFTVRDLMLLRVFEGDPRISSVKWLERPSFPFEGRVGAEIPLADKINIRSHRAFNVFSAMRYKRLWPKISMNVHNKYLKSWVDNSDGLKVILDFHPFYIPDAELVAREDVIYWYDLIDNFSVHNVFSNAQRQAVAEKYNFVRKYANLVTGVSDRAVSSFARGVVVPNRLVRDSASQMADGDYDYTPFYDFGFTGFITDKMDLDLLRRLSALGYKTLVRGKAYHPDMMKKLHEIEGVTVGGAYHASEQAEIIRSFRIGLIPYLKEKSHDESPIKLTQYLANFRPALISMNFGELDREFSAWVVNYDKMNDGELKSAINYLINVYNDELFRKDVRASKSLFWDTQIDKVLGLLGVG